MSYEGTAAAIRNKEFMLSRLEEEMKKSPRFYGERLRMLDGFFSEHQAPVDIAFILHGAYPCAHTIAHHLDGNGLLFYRPMASHKMPLPNPVFIGIMSPQRDLLLFDVDMVTGAAMSEAAEYFTAAGYQRSCIFGYLNLGYKDKSSGPVLKQIDDLLKPS